MKNIAIILPMGSLPVPAINGGAIETLLELLINENEKLKKYKLHILMCKNKNDKYIYNYSNYKYTKFYNLYVSTFNFKINRLINAGNKRLNYILPLYSKFDRYVIKTLKQINPDLIIIEGAYNNVVNLLNNHYPRNMLAYHVHHQVLPKKDISKYFGSVFCVSNFIKNDWIENCKFKNDINFYVWQNAINEAIFNKKMSDEEKVELRKSLEIKNDDFVVIYVGRLVNGKGVDKLIKSLISLSNDKIKLVIVGQSIFKYSKPNSYTKYLNDLAKPIKDRIIFTGFIDNDKIYKYYNIADVHVLPSTWEEAAGLVVLESSCVGTKQIITNSGGAPEYASPNAIIIDKNKNIVDNLANAINEVYKNNEREKKPISVRGSNFYYEQFSEIIEKLNNN